LSPFSPSLPSDGYLILIDGAIAAQTPTVEVELLDNDGTFLLDNDGVQLLDNV